MRKASAGSGCPDAAIAIIDHLACDIVGKAVAAIVVVPPGGIQSRQSVAARTHPQGAMHVLVQRPDVGIQARLIDAFAVASLAPVETVLGADPQPAAAILQQGGYRQAFVFGHRWSHAASAEWIVDDEESLRSADQERTGVAEGQRAHIDGGRLWHQNDR